MRAAKILILSYAETEDKKAYLDRKAIESMKERYDDNIQVTYDIKNLQDVDAVCVANDIGYFQPNAVRDPKWRETMRKVSEKCEKVFSVAYAVPELEKQHFVTSTCLSRNVRLPPMRAFWSRFQRQQNLT